MHVRGFSKRHPGIPERPARHLRSADDRAGASTISSSSGVTAVELMPVHHHARDRHLEEKGLTNYWGYNSFGYFAPERRLAASRTPAGAVREFKRMVRALHAAGLEVILDVVYNHTAEGNQLGPTLSLKGIDNASYYRLVADDPRYYMDFTGCGNTLNMQSPAGAAADHGQPALLGARDARRRLPVRPGQRARARAVRRRPARRVLRHHPPGPGAVAGEADRRAVGSRRRAATRSATSRCCGRNGTASIATRCGGSGAATAARVSELATRLSGSNDLYAHSGRQPYASINFVTAHDGFTLNDLVSYNEKHNEANGEDNRDGENNNLSWNCGVEGPTDDPAIAELRARQMRNFLATLLLSQGVPMISHGDELGAHAAGQQQRLLPGQRADLDRLEPRRPTSRRCSSSSRRLVHFRLSQPVLRRRKYFQGRSIRGGDVKDVAWLAPDGREMDRRRLERRLRPQPRHAALRATRSKRSTSAASRSSATRCWCCSTRTRQGAVHAAAARGRPAVAAGGRHRRRARAPSGCSGPAAAIRCRAARWPCSGSCRRCANGAASRTSDRRSRRQRRRPAARSSREPVAVAAESVMARRSSSRQSTVSSPPSGDSRAALRRDRRPPTADSRAASSSSDVRPAIDGGRFPIKRTPGEFVDVTADIFADGHDVIVARCCRDRRSASRHERGPAARADRAGAKRRWSLVAPGHRRMDRRASTSTASAGTSTRSSPGSIGS